MDIQQKEPHGANIQTPIKSNLPKNFGLNTKNQFFKSIRPTNFIGSIAFNSFISFIRFTRSTDVTTSIRPTKSTNVIDFTGPIEITNVTGFIENTSSTKNSLILEDITQQLLESKHTFTLGQLFRIAPNLKQYVVTKFAFKRKTIMTSKPNLIIAFVMIDPKMAMIQIQVGKKWLRASYQMEDSTWTS